MNRDEALFVNLVMIFKSAAMQQMGKVVNPLTGKVERNLEQARFSIDTIAMLKDKTRGNISEDLTKLLDSVLMELRMNFVEETKVGDTPSAAEEPAEGTESAASGAAEPDEEERGAGGEGAGPDAEPEDAQNGREGK